MSGACYRLKLLPLRHRRDEHDLGEKKSHGAVGEIGHHPLQSLGWSWCLPIVARGHGGQARDSPTHYATDPGLQGGPAEPLLILRLTGDALAAAPARRALDRPSSRS
jgi:hypothetical protein